MFQDRMSESIGGPITEGVTVYGSDGAKLGTVQNYDPTAGYLEVRKGWLFPKDFYVPLSAVDTVTEDGVVLRLSQDELTDERYASPPAVGSGMGEFRAGGTGVSDYGTAASGTGEYRPIGADMAAVDRTAGTDVAAGRAAQLRQGEDLRVPVQEEELVAGKRPEEQGRVHVHKDVVEEQQTLNVPVSRERVTVERVPFSGGDVPTEDAFQERDIDVPVMGEEVVAEKRVRGVEEVRIRKDTVTEQRQVGDTVRREQVTVEGADEVDRQSMGRRADKYPQPSADPATDELRSANDPRIGR